MNTRCPGADETDPWILDAWLGVYAPWLWALPQDAPADGANRNERRRESVKVAKTEDRDLGEFLELRSFFFHYKSTT